MSSAEVLETIRAMPAAERRVVIGKIWSEFAEADLETTPEQSAELDWRIQEHAAHPNEVVSWNEVKLATEAKYGGKN